jgi:hypothetical protein
MTTGDKKCGGCSVDEHKSRGFPAQVRHKSPKPPDKSPSGRPSPRIQKGACDTFKNLGTVEDYHELLSVAHKFRRWKDQFLNPLIKNLDTNYHNLVGTNHVLHELTELVNSSVSSPELDRLMSNVDGQIKMLGKHLDVLGNVPGRLQAFKHRAAKRMKQLHEDYAAVSKRLRRVGHTRRTHQHVPEPKIILEHARKRKKRHHHSRHDKDRKKSCRKHRKRKTHRKKKSLHAKTPKRRTRHSTYYLSPVRSVLEPSHRSKKRRKKRRVLRSF